MIFRVILAILLIFNGGVSFAQLAASAEKSALRNIEKHRWQKAESKLRKTLLKDSLSPSVRYVMAVFYFQPDNPGYDLDSAHRYSVSALSAYRFATPRARDRLARLSVDSINLVAFRAKIDSAAFELAKKTHTEAGYLHFLSHFPFAFQRSLAEALRDEVSYQEALKENTYQAFHSFLDRYPYAKSAAEALAHYNRLLYLEKTKDGRLSSFESFLREHPETPYHEEIYQHIFEISTADGKAESFVTFMNRYPMSDLAKKAGQLAFHILADEEDTKWPRHFLNDSLKNILSLRKPYLVPVSRNRLYGFIDEKGREIIAPEFNTIHPDYLCGRVTGDVLMADNGLVARDGSVIYDGPVQEMEEMGIGFLRIMTPSGMKVFHKAGFTVADSIEDANVLADSFLAIKKFDAWFLYTLTGKLLDANPWDQILAYGNAVVFKSGKKVFVASKERLAKIADGHSLDLSRPFDEVKLWPHDLLWVRSGAMEGVLNQSLDVVIPLERHVLTQTFFGASARQSNGFDLYNWRGEKASGFSRINIFGQWVTVKKQASWLLFDPRFRQIESKPYDTIKAEGPFVIGVQTDTVYVHFTGNRIRMFISPKRVSFIPGMDTTSFLLVEEEKQKTVFDLKGRKMFSAEFDGIRYAGDGVFVITKNDKRGLLNASGENLLPAEFDAIGSVTRQGISLLKNKRFGCYNIQDKKLIRPQYDRNLHAYTPTVLTTFHDGYYGFLGWDNKPISKFEFEEIAYWNDSVALVKKGPYWNLYDIAGAKIAAGNFRSIRFIKNSEDEKVAILQKDNDFGVMSNRRGWVIPVSFSDIINLGSRETPLYFAEKQVREAALFIVIYYDRSGDMLRKEIYDDPADYDRIYCSDN